MYACVAEHRAAVSCILTFKFRKFVLFAAHFAQSALEIVLTHVSCAFDVVERRVFDLVVLGSVVDDELLLTVDGKLQ